MMFTYPNEEFELEVMHVGNTAKPKLKKDANKFIEEYKNNPDYDKRLNYSEKILKTLLTFDDI